MGRERGWGAAQYLVALVWGFHSLISRSHQDCLVPKCSKHDAFSLGGRCVEKNVLPPGKVRRLHIIKLFALSYYWSLDPTQCSSESFKINTVTTESLRFRPNTRPVQLIVSQTEMRLSNHTSAFHTSGGTDATSIHLFLFSCSSIWRLRTTTAVRFVFWRLI